MKENFDIVPTKEPNKEKEKEEKEREIDAAADWVLKMLENNDSYRERIPLNKDRSFDLPKDVTEIPGQQLLRYAYKTKLNQEGLKNLTEEISKKYQNLHFSFKFGPKNEWMEYIAKKQNLSEGDSVIWDHQGITQWDKPKKISSIQKDPKSGRKFAIFEDSTTGIPLEELNLIEDGN